MSPLFQDIALFSFKTPIGDDLSKPIKRIEKKKTNKQKQQQQQQKTNNENIETFQMDLIYEIKC